MSQRILVGMGELWFGGGDVRLATLLGSCVAICLWHPRRHVGGLAHVVLPTRGEPADEDDPRYADEAMHLFAGHAARLGSSLPEYQAKIFGGGNMLDSPQRPVPLLDIGGRNVAAVEELVEACGITVHARHLGGSGHRKLEFNLSTGDVWLAFPGGHGERRDVRQERANE